MRFRNIALLLVFVMIAMPAVQAFAGAGPGSAYAEEPAISAAEGPAEDSAEGPAEDPAEGPDSATGTAGEPAACLPALEDMAEGIVTEPDPEEGPGLEPFASSGSQAFIDEVVRLVNVERAKYGLPPLAGWYTALNSAAAVRAGEVSTYFSHTRPNGKSCFSALDDKGVKYGWAGENIAAGYATPAAVVAGWMNSPGHRDNILDAHFNYIGVGYVYRNDNSYRHYWVQMFAGVPPTPATSVTLSKSSVGVKEGKTATLTATMKPLYSTDTVAWSSSDPSVATVSGGDYFGSTGKVKGISRGTAKITAKTSDKVLAECTVTVTTTPYSIPRITGIDPPVSGKAPGASIAATAQYTGSISWSPAIEGGVFEYGTEYTATITLTPKPGYGPYGIPADYFKVVGASSVTNEAETGVVKAVFPKTGAADAAVAIKMIPLAAPVAGAAPQASIETDEYTGRVSWSPAVGGAFAGKTGYTASIMLTAKPGFTLSGVPDGFFVIGGAGTVSYAEGTSDVIAEFPDTDWAEATRLSISPSHAILAAPGDIASFTAVLAPEGADIGRVKWGFSSSVGVMLSGGPGDEVATVELLAPAQEAGTLTVTAIYTGDGGEGIYSATATVELLPGEEVSSSTAVRLLETKVTVNKAKDVGGTLPILITEQPPSSYGLSAFSVSPMGGSAGSLLIDRVALFTRDGSKEWTVPLTTFEAHMCPADDRYIEINALSGAKDTSNVRVKVLPAGEDPGDPGKWLMAEGKISLAVVAKYPKISLKAGELSLVFKDRPAALTASSPDGAIEVLGIKAEKAADEGKVMFDGNGLRIDSASKAAAFTVKVNAKVEGYKPLAEKNWPKVKVKVVSALPKLKLSSGTVKLAGAADAPVSILSADKKKTLENWGRIDRVTIDGGAADLLRHGKAYVPGETKAGSHKLNVHFLGASKAVDLKIAVKRVKLESATISSKTKSIVVSKGHETGKDIVTVKIAPNAANLTVSDFEAAGCPAGIGFSPGPNSITFRVTDALAATKKPVTVKINSPTMQFSKPVKISFSITGSKPKCTVSVKGAIDIANPKSMATATVKLTNTTSAIKEVELTGTGSESFDVDVIAANKFAIRGREGTLPGITRSLGVAVSLENGETLTAARLVTIKPKQTVGKAYRSLTRITLYKTTPLTGRAVGLDLKTPANARLGAVRINEASVDSMKFDNSLPNNGFELRQSGKNEWTVYFKGGKAPVPADAKPLKASYKLKIELWADGTYVKTPDGSFSDCLRDGKGNPKSKPRVVTIKVTIK